MFSFLANSFNTGKKFSSSIADSASSRAVAAKNVNVDLISAGASMVAYHFTVDRRDLKNTITAIHEEFFKDEIQANGPMKVFSQYR